MIYGLQEHFNPLVLLRMYVIIIDSSVREESHADRAEIFRPVSIFYWEVLGWILFEATNWNII